MSSETWLRIVANSGFGLFPTCVKIMRSCNQQCHASYYTTNLLAENLLKIYCNVAICKTLPEMFMSKKKMSNIKIIIIRDSLGPRNIAA